MKHILAKFTLLVPPVEINAVDFYLGRAKINDVYVGESSTDLKYGKNDNATQPKNDHKLKKPPAHSTNNCDTLPGISGQPGQRRFDGGCLGMMYTHITRID